MAITCLYVTVVVGDFKLAIWIYDNFLSELYNKNEKLLHEIFKQIHKSLENTLYLWLKNIKELLFALIGGLIPLLPSVIKTPLDFVGIS